MPSSLRRILDALAEGDPITAQPVDEAGDTPSVEGLGRSDAIRVAMEGERKLTLFYRRKRDGVEARYTVAPYSYRDRPWGRMLYGTERKHGAAQIHGFYVSRISHAAVLPRSKFHPRWDVEPE